MRFLYLVLASLTIGTLVGHFFSPDFGNAYELMLYVLIFMIGMDLGLNFNADELNPRRTAGVADSWNRAKMGPRHRGQLWMVLADGPDNSAVLRGLRRGRLSRQSDEGNPDHHVLPNCDQEDRPRKGGGDGRATTMDTTLPVITKFGGREVALVAFVHGFILTAVVPFLVPLILSL